jgi:predicted alpha/beta-hydrolase family hydrolase
VRALELDGRTALLDRPRSAKQLLVLAHGAGAGMRHGFLAAIAAGLARHRVATLRWEMPYMAAGRRRPDSAAVAEAAVRANWLATSRRLRGLAMFAGGKSFGGRMTTQAHAGSPLPDARGLVVLGFPVMAKPERMAHLPRTAGPLLIIQGSDDEVAALRPVVDGLGRRATLHEIAGADHGFAVPRRPAAEVIAEIAAAVATWMARH